MGWGSGSALASEVCTLLTKKVADIPLCTEVMAEVLRAFDRFDCDTLYELYTWGEDERVDNALMAAGIITMEWVNEMKEGH